MTILVNPARFRFGADTAIGRLLGDEPAGLAVDFTTMQALVRDNTTPVVNYLGSVDLLLTYTAPSPKMVWDVAGLLGYGSHNLFLNSGVPANQSVTVVSGVQYAVTLTGATVTTLSGAATGTLSAGTTVITTTTTTLTFGTTSGAGTVQVSRYPVHAGYLATTGAVRYGIPLDYDPVTHAPLGVLVEEQRTNLLLRSQEIDNASWTKAAVTVTANAAVAPDGTTTADKLAADAAAAEHKIYQSRPSSLVAHAWSIYAKAAELSWLFIDAADGSTNPYTYFNLTTGVVGTVGAGSTASIQNVGNGWYRCAVVRTAVNATVYGQVGVTTANGLISSTPGTGNGVYIWGYQLEAGAF